MSGKEILVDTNIILYLLSKSDTLENYLQGKDIYVSFITDLELVAPKSIPIQEEQKIIELLSDCTIIPLNNRIKEKYIEIRKKHSLKLADAIIAATAVAFDFPLITADKQFKTVKELKLITYQHSIDLT
ncbi:MAG: type II toxin-antitoxin system VapC family toxin [Mucilaginibacter sp.]